MSADSRRTFLHELGGCALAACALFGLGLDVKGLPVIEATAEAAGTERRYPIPAGDGVTIDRASAVILVRLQNQVYAFSLACPHQHAAIRWLDAERRFECTKHHSKYQPDGTYTSGRATRNLDRFPIRLDGSAVVIDATRVFESDKDGAGWAAARVGVS